MIRFTVNAQSHWGDVVRFCAHGHGLSLQLLSNRKSKGTIHNEKRVLQSTRFSVHWILSAWCHHIFYYPIIRHMSYERKAEKMFTAHQINSNNVSLHSTTFSAVPMIRRSYISEEPSAHRFFPDSALRLNAVRSAVWAGRYKAEARADILYVVTFKFEFTEWGEA